MTMEMEPCHGNRLPRIVSVAGQFHDATDELYQVVSFLRRVHADDLGHYHGNNVQHIMRILALKYGPHDDEDSNRTVPMATNTTVIPRVQSVAEPRPCQGPGCYSNHSRTRARRAAAAPPAPARTGAGNLSQEELNVTVPDDFDQDHHYLKHSKSYKYLEIAHKLHYCSIAILGAIVLQLMFRVYGMGREFFQQKMEMFDAVIILASFALDLVFLEGISGAEGQEGAVLLICFLLWRILRVINGIMVTTKKRQEFRVKLQKRARRRMDKRMETLEEEKKLLNKEIAALKHMCQNYGVSANEITGCRPKRNMHRMDTSSGLTSVASLSLGLSMSISGGGMLKDVNEVARSNPVLNRRESIDLLSVEAKRRQSLAHVIQNQWEKSPGQAKRPSMEAVEEESNEEEDDEDEEGEPRRKPSRHEGFENPLLPSEEGDHPLTEGEGPLQHPLLPREDTMESTLLDDDVTAADHGPDHAEMHQEDLDDDDVTENGPLLNNNIKVTVTSPSSRTMTSPMATGATLPGNGNNRKLSAPDNHDVVMVTTPQQHQPPTVLVDGPVDMETTPSPPEVDNPLQQRSCPLLPDLPDNELLWISRFRSVSMETPLTSGSSEPSDTEDPSRSPGRRDPSSPARRAQRAVTPEPAVWRHIDAPQQSLCQSQTSPHRTTRSQSLSDPPGLPGRRTISPTDLLLDEVGWPPAWAGLGSGDVTEARDKGSTGGYSNTGIPHRSTGTSQAGEQVRTVHRPEGHRNTAHGGIQGHRKTSNRTSSAHNTAGPRLAGVLSNEGPPTAGVQGVGPRTTGGHGMEGHSGAVSHGKRAGTHSDFVFQPHVNSQNKKKTLEDLPSTPV